MRYIYSGVCILAVIVREFVYLFLPLYYYLMISKDLLFNLIYTQSLYVVVNIPIIYQLYVHIVAGHTQKCVQVACTRGDLVTACIPSPCIVSIYVHICTNTRHINVADAPTLTKKISLVIYNIHIVYLTRKYYIINNINNKKAL